ncbi:MAG TPA: hypothetical protein VGI23_08755, partial [Steroidobacteraceae bacterium]
MNESLGSSDSALSLRQALGDALYSAGDRLAESGGVLEVRVLQGGQIVTGIVGGDSASSLDSGDGGAMATMGAEAKFGGARDAGDPGATVAPTGGADAGMQVGSKAAAHGGTQVGSKAAAHGGTQVGSIAAANGGPKGATKFRVYIRGAQRECSCGARGVCVHVAAVSIVAARTGGGAAARGSAAGVRAAPGLAGTGSALAAQVGAAQVGPAQQLCYLLEVEGEALRGIRASVWVAQRGTDVGSIVPGSACAFALRRASIASAFEFPRYVDQADREILPALPEGALGSSELLMRIVSTGRAFLGAVGGTPLRAGAARDIALVWKTLSGGDQVLGWEGEQEVLLGLEPPAYVDATAGVAGAVELPCGVELAREMARLGAVGPELVGEMNARIARACGGSAAQGSSVSTLAGAVQGDAAERAGVSRVADAASPGTDVGAAGAERRRGGAAYFPRLREFAPVVESLRSVAPRVVLGAGEQAIVYFVYNDTPVDSRRLRDGDRTVRFVADAALYEIPRDLAAEASFRSQLGELPGGRVPWLEFMMNRVPVLKELGWSVEVEAGFPYRIVTASQWYGYLGADQRQAAWFNLRLGVMVDGQPVNLLPALTRYLRSSLGGDADADGCRVGDHWLVRLADGRYLPIEIERIQRIA